MDQNMNMDVLDQTEKPQENDIMALLGADVDSQLYRDNLETYFGNDTQTISTGGLTIFPNSQTIILKPQISNSVLQGKSMYLLGKFLGGCKYDVPINALSMFRPVSFKIGNFTQTYSYGEIYIQQMLEQINLVSIQAYKDGLWIANIDDDGALNMKMITTNANVDGVNANNNPYGEYETAFLQGAPGVASAQGSRYHNLIQQYASSLATRGDKYFAIPIWLLFYPLIQSIDFELFVKFPGQLEFQIQTVPTLENIIQILPPNQALGTAATDYTAYRPGPTGAVPIAGGSQATADLDYSLTNIMTNTPTLLEALLKSEIEYRPKYFNQSVNLTFSMSREMRLHALTFGVHHQSAYRAANLIADQASFYSGTSCLSGECILFPKYKIKFMSINNSGRITTLNAQSIAAMQLIQPSQIAGVAYPNHEGPYKGGKWRDLRCPYVLDMSRYGFEDLIGSSQSITANITVQIQFDFTEDLSIYGGSQITGNSVTTSYQGNIPNPQYQMVYGFLVVSSKMVMKNGEYFAA